MFEPSGVPRASYETLPDCLGEMPAESGTNRRVSSAQPPNCRWKRIGWLSIAESQRSLIANGSDGSSNNTSGSNEP